MACCCFFYVHPMHPLLISCTFCLRAWKEAAVSCARKSVHKANPSAFNAYIQSVFVGSRVYVCLRAGMCVWVRACVPQRRANGSCSLFTPQPSALPPACHSAAWPLSTSSISKRLNGGEESGRNLLKYNHRNLGKWGPSWRSLQSGFSESWMKWWKRAFKMNNGDELREWGEKT